MKVTQFKLKLENGEIINCSKGGEGARIGFIVGGPGSFYLNGLAALENVYTFITFDSIWTYGKGSSLGEKQIGAVTKESIKGRDHQIVQALKAHFNVLEIDGFGFSAPGAFLFEEALDHPKDFARLIGTGIGLTELDPTFTKTNEIFFEKASPERKKSFEDYQTKFHQLQSDIDRNHVVSDQRLAAFFDLKPGTKLPLKPHKQFVIETISMVPKLFFNYGDSEKAKLQIIEHWKHNPIREHIDKRMQAHFFTTVYPQLTPASTLMQLAKANKDILLVYGETDFITPLPDDMLAALQRYPTIKIAKMEGCGHVTYQESPKQYAELIMRFIGSEKSLQIDSMQTTLSECPKF